MKFESILHFWTKHYEIDLLAPFREIARDLKRLKKSLDKRNQK